jgi:hypothetical protein
MKLTLLFFIMFLSLETFGQSLNIRNTYYFTNSLLSRAPAMGDAFTAVQDYVESGLYNPAALSSEGGAVSSIFFSFNPVGAIDAGYHISDLSIRQELAGNDFVAMLGILMHSLSISSGPLQFSLVLSEELPNNPYRTVTDKKVTTEYLLDWNYHIASLRLKLAKQVYMGTSLFVFNQTIPEDQTFVQKSKIGASYGILMMPASNFSIGLTLFNIPSSAETQMFLQHRIHHQSINFGLCYQPFRPLRLAVDFRNVSEENAQSNSEVHGGIEVLPFRFLALRSGYYRIATLDKDVFSAGIGIADFRDYKPVRERFVLSKILLNYALQAEKTRDDVNLVHYLTFLFRL